MNSKRMIRKVAVLGSGGPGTGLACHFANAGLPVLLLGDAGAGNGAKMRNKPANDALAAALKCNPTPLYAKSLAQHIETGNFEDDMPKIAHCDWVIVCGDGQPEAMQKLFEQVESFRKAGTLVSAVSADTQLPGDKLGDDFRENFCGLHFSGVPRYAETLEILPTADTSPEVVDFLMLYGEKFLGKTTVLSNAGKFAPVDDGSQKRMLWGNGTASITDAGDGIICLELHAENNIIDTEAIAAINHALALAEKDYNGLLICAKGDDFCTGADFETIYSMAAEADVAGLNAFAKILQDTMMRVRYSAVPVVVAVQGKVLGLGCELCLHADRVVAHAELRMGLNQFDSGLLPFGGGIKEFALRLNEERQEGDVEVNDYRRRLLTIAQAKVSSSAQEAFETDYLQKGRDIVVMSRRRLFNVAKQQCLLLADAGYVPPAPRKDIRVLGKLALGVGYIGANSMYAGNYISEYDMRLSQKQAFVLAGGDLSQPTLVNEDYLLRLEREAFVTICLSPEAREKLKKSI